MKAAPSHPALFDARAWLFWLIASAVAAMSARNPLYSVLLIFVFRIVNERCALPETGIRLPFWRLTAVTLLFSTGFNMLFVHTGDTVLFRLPEQLPLIGGAITLEAAVYGFSGGLLLLALLAAFTAFNAAVPISDLVKLTPRALHDLGMVALIAAAYLPETHRQLQRIREAQAVRGHRLRGWRDWRPVIIPLLVGGMERAMNLSEAMTARGYGSVLDRRQTWRRQMILLGGMMVAFSGWALTFWAIWPGRALLAIGTLSFLLMLWRLGKQSPHTNYRPRQWGGWDTALALAATLPLILVLTMDTPALFYSPYPAAALPEFDLVLGASVLFFLLPALKPLADAEGINDVL